MLTLGFHVLHTRIFFKLEEATQSMHCRIHSIHIQELATAGWRRASADNKFKGRVARAPLAPHFVTAGQLLAPDLGHHAVAARPSFVCASGLLFAHPYEHLETAQKRLARKRPSLPIQRQPLLPIHIPSPPVPFPVLQRSYPDCPLLLSIPSPPSHTRPSCSVSVSYSLSSAPVLPSFFLPSPLLFC